MRTLPLILWLLSVSVLMAADFPNDADLLAMAKRRVAAGDLGLTFEQQLPLQRGLNQGIVATGDPTIVARGTVTADQRLPVRFQVMVVNVRNAGEDQKSIAVIDAWFKQDAFGTWGMEWRYNTDQTLLSLEANKAAIAAAEAKDPDAVWRKKLPTMLKAGYFPAQVQFQGGNYEDGDGNGIGNYAADLEVLDGSRIAKGMQQSLSLLPKNFISDLTKAGIKYRTLAETERGMWMFAVLPSGTETLLMSADGQVRELDGAVLPVSIEEAKAATARATVSRQR